MWLFQPSPAAISGTGVNGVLSVTLGALTLSSAGTVLVKGQLSVTLGAITFSATTSTSSPRPNLMAGRLVGESVLLAGLAG